MQWTPTFLNLALMMQSVPDRYVYLPIAGKADSRRRNNILFQNLELIWQILLLKREALLISFKHFHHVLQWPLLLHILKPGT